MSEIVSAAPPSGGITWADHQGRLLLVEPKSFEQGIQTSFGAADAVKADVYVLTGPDTAEEFEDCLVFPKLLASQLKNQIGNKVAGRLSQGAAKPGQSAPWILEPATPEDIEKVQAYLTKRQSPVTVPDAPTSQAPF